MSQKTISEIIADFTLGLSLDDVPLEVQKKCKIMIMDALGVGLVAFDQRPTEIVRNVILDMNKGGDSTLWGTDKKVCLADAVLHNGALIHGIEYDDTHVPGIVHTSSIIVNAALTIGEAVGATGREIMEAAIAGYEVIIRLGLAAPGRFHMRGFQTTGIAGCFVASCIAAKLMKMSRNELINAMGINGSQAAALMEFSRDGSWPKKIHTGWPCHSAIYAVLMAKQGFTGPPTIFEGETGVWKSHIGDTEGLFEAFEDLGKRWYTTEVVSKLYPVCHYIASFVDCVFAMKEKYNITADQVAEVVCRIDPVEALTVTEPIEAKRRPDSDNAMRYSLPYCIAMALKYNQLGHAEINNRYLNDPELEALMDKVTCITDPAAAVKGHFPGDVKIILTNGQTYSMQQKSEMGGSPECPMDPALLVKKFTENASMCLSEEKVAELLQKLPDFENLETVADIIADLKIER